MKKHPEECLSTEPSHLYSVIDSDPHGALLELPNRSRDRQNVWLASRRMQNHTPACSNEHIATFARSYRQDVLRRVVSGPRHGYGVSTIDCRLIGRNGARHRRMRYRQCSERKQRANDGTEYNSFHRGFRLVYKSTFIQPSLASLT